MDNIANLPARQFEWPRLHGPSGQGFAPSRHKMRLASPVKIPLNQQGGRLQKETLTTLVSPDNSTVHWCKLWNFFRNL